MSISRNMAAAVVLMAALSPVATAHTGEKLSGGEIAALFPGQFEAIWKDKHQVSVVVESDGEMRGSTGMMSDSGQWSIDGDQLCVAFYWWTSNKPRCTEVVLDEGWYLGMHNSSGEPRVRFRPQ